MNMLSQSALALCYLSVAVTVISLFLPQKRTRKIFSFVIGLFVIGSLIACIRNTTVEIDGLTLDQTAYPITDQGEYLDAVRQETVERVVSATDELLRSNGIEVRDIRISLNISDEGRIYAGNIVIYISEDDLPRKQEIERIIYGNFSKEPQVYVEKEEVE